MLNFPTGIVRAVRGVKTYIPPTINFPYTWGDPTINHLLAEASRMIGELNAYTILVPDVDYFIKMHVAKEANASSCTERIHLTMADTVSPVSEVDPESRDDWQEVHNYIQAINYAVAELEKLPFSMRLVHQTHAKLLDSVRGYTKTPGQIRTSQNWIGPSLAEAVFIPPPPEELPALLDDLQRYWHNRDIATPDLIRIAISHYQFETVHPYLDGNGRLGRLIIPLHLVSLSMLHKPSLYLSDYFERNKVEYVDLMMKVHRDGSNMDEWIIFFLTGVTEIAKQSRDTLKTIVELRQKYDALIDSRVGARRRPYAKKALLHLFSNPIVAAKDLMQVPEHEPVTVQTAHNLIDDLHKSGMLEEISGLKSNRRYVLKEYFDLFDRPSHNPN